MAGLGLCVGLLVACLFASLGLGAADISPGEVWQAVVAYDDSITNHLIIQTVRGPRSLTALSVGAASAVAGAIMQGVTRNPLADPGILGINAGASLAVVGAIFWLGSPSLNVYAGFAFLGAAIAAVTVYGLSSLSRSGATPLNLTIAGAAIAAFVSSLTAGALIVSQRTLEEIRFWLAGSVAGRDFELVVQILPYLIIGLLSAMLLGKQLTTLSLGEGVARGLGQRTEWVKAVAAVVVVLLAGGSVAIAGPIGFVGLVVPHLVRFWVGADYRWIIPYAAVGGGILLVLADITARLVIQPLELPVGLVMPMVGAPFLIYLVRWRVRR